MGVAQERLRDSIRVTRALLVRMRRIDDRRNDARRQEGKRDDRRMCRPPWTSRLAISTKEPLRPSLMSSIHPLAIAGERRLTEWEVPWLPGYEGSAPVRLGTLLAGEAKAKEISQPMNIAVVDAGTNLKAFTRMDGAWLGSILRRARKCPTSICCRPA